MLSLYTYDSEISQSKPDNIYKRVKIIHAQKQQHKNINLQKNSKKKLFGVLFSSS
jgi:hypothetical protein